MQVSGFNGAASPTPYLLRITVLEPAARPACAARTVGTAGTEASLPSSIPADTRTLFLVNQERLGDLYGASQAASVMSELADLAAYEDPAGDEFDVRGAVIPVDGDAGVRNAYDTWDANPCSTAGRQHDRHRDQPGRRRPA